MIKQVKTSEYLPNTPELCLAQFIFEWQRGNWHGMVTYAQNSWVSETTDPAAMLCFFFGHRQPLEVYHINRIENKDTNPDVVADLEVVVVFKTYQTKTYPGKEKGTTTRQRWGKGKREKKKLSARAMCETSDGSSSKEGVWGINAVSALRVA